MRPRGAVRMGADDLLIVFDPEGKKDPRRE